MDKLYKWIVTLNAGLGEIVGEVGGSGGTGDNAFVGGGVCVVEIGRVPGAF